MATAGTEFSFVFATLFDSYVSIEEAHQAYRLAFEEEKAARAEYNRITRGLKLTKKEAGVNKC
jgi:hypothetical protein